MALRFCKGISRICRLADKFGHLSVCRRFFLSEAYSCDDAWKRRLQSPIMQQIDPAEFAAKLQGAFDRDVKPTAIDMDILANNISEIDPLHLDFVQNLFYMFRHSAEAKFVRESMSHALIRALLAFGETERLMSILRDKIHYGIFLDDYTANMLMDHFLEHKLYTEAAEIAIDMMLQEDFSHPVTRTFALYATHLRLKELQVTPEEPVEAEAAEDEEMKYRRVGYIKTPWYDDHFDIPTEKQRLGKVLIIATNFEEDSLLSRSFKLIGWAFFEKFDKGLDLIKSWLESVESPVVSQQELDLFGKLIDDVKTKELVPKPEPGLLRIQDLYPFITTEQKSQYQQSFQELAGQLKKAGKITSDVDFEKDLMKLLEQRIRICEPFDIANQKKLFTEWEQDRAQLLEKQIQYYQMEQKKRKIAERLLELKAKEEKLRYFEQKIKIELKIADTPKMQQIEEVVEEEQFVAPPGERKTDKKAR